MNIAERTQQVRLNIQQYCVEFARNTAQVRLMAVSKTHPVSAIQDAVVAGITEFGESYLSEAISKIKNCQNLPITWHFIGHLQTNKAKHIPARVVGAMIIIFIAMIMLASWYINLGLAD